MGWKYGERIKYIREQTNITQDDLALKMGVKKSTISKWETETHEPKQEQFRKMAEILKVNPMWLLGADVPMRIENIRPVKQIPILGKIAAGQPILAVENIEGYEWVDNHIHVDFCLKVKGDSMKNARIYDGDIVYIRKQPDVESGEIAAVLVDNEEATIKKVIKDGNRLILMPANPDYAPTVFNRTEARDVKIIGKAIIIKFEVK